MPLFYYICIYVYWYISKYINFCQLLRQINEQMNLEMSYAIITIYIGVISNLKNKGGICGR